MQFKLTKKLGRKMVGFSKVGVVVTLMSMTLTYVLLKIIGTPLIPTYVLLYLTMILFSYLLNSTYVFKAKKGANTLFQYYLAYGFSMCLGVVLLSIFREILPFENWILAYMVIPFTMTSNFLLASFIFKGVGHE